MSARDPEAILAELGHDLRAAWARPPRRALLRALAARARARPRAAGARPDRAGHPRRDLGARPGAAARRRATARRRSPRSARAPRSTSRRASSAASRGG